ncbi:thioredoxin-like 1-2, chloroplastic [Dendrobium catenatum]|uniref:Thioredoxin-like 1-2, chloroplastic n=1 Tax=Dendrobium catenatum TaxID=906689 RepID=A0A2I0VJJ8_9ASPA|nr:thioredoxin-like 1-2, chloroplastic [Dendrobium catenatum]PKU63585.1 Thioredoxin-like 1-2, chloroplastic [Dendrobium catenatum]
MADVMSKGSVFSPHRCRSSSISSKRSKPLSANLFRSSIGLARSPFSSKSDLLGRVVIERQKGKVANRVHHAVPVRMDLPIGKGMRWWEKGLQPNMKEITSAQDLVDSLIHAGDRLVIVDFYSPGCGGCKSLHPKICQFAEQNPHVLFLPVNYEKHKSMCYSLNVHVLPFFRFYRGAHGRLCSFSCTNATIKKFKDALAKHDTGKFSLGAAKGLEEKELLALAANKDLCFNQTKKEKPSSTAPEVMEQIPAIL